MQRWISIRRRSPPTGVRWEKDYCKCWGKRGKEEGSSSSDEHWRTFLSVTCVSRAAEVRGCGWYGFAIHFFQSTQMLYRWCLDAIRQASVCVMLICPHTCAQLRYRWIQCPSFFQFILLPLFILQCCVFNFLAWSISSRTCVQLQSFQSPYQKQITLTTHCSHTWRITISFLQLWRSI